MLAAEAGDRAATELKLLRYLSVYSALPIASLAGASASFPNPFELRETVATTLDHAARTADGRRLIRTRLSHG